MLCSFCRALGKHVHLLSFLDFDERFTVEIMEVNDREFFAWRGRMLLGKAVLFRKGDKDSLLIKLNGGERARMKERRDD